MSSFLIYQTMTFGILLNSIIMWIVDGKASGSGLIATITSSEKSSKQYYHGPNRMRCPLMTRLFLSAYE